MRRYALVVALLLLAACGDTARPLPKPEPEPLLVHGARDVVLRVHHHGGLRAPHPGRLPSRWVLYGDGRVLTPLGTDAQRGSALRTVAVTSLSPADIGVVLRAAREAGLNEAPVDYGRARVEDAGNTLITLLHEGATVTHTIHALEVGGSGLSADQLSARRRVHSFLRQLEELPAWLGLDSPASTELVPTSVAVWAEPFPPRTGSDAVVAWPGPDLTRGGVVSHYGRCFVLTGPALDRALPTLRSAPSSVRWTAQGKSWLLAIRPLYPDEGPGCPTQAN